ncbi:MAG: hypothetical protein ACREGI_04765 [Candidatus Levyibacteriota bacterium]
MKKNIIITIVCVVVVGVAAFFGGVWYQKSQAPTFGNGQFRGRFGGANGGNQAFRPVRGQVVSSDQNSLTVKMQDGTSRIVILSGSTSFLKSAAASKDDIKSGDTVMVVGSANPDGSVTAQNVDINPPTGGQRPSPTGGAQ